MERGKVEGQERLEDETFELREPVERNRKIELDCMFIASRQEYQVKLGPVFNGRAKTLAEALHQLANRLDAERIYGSEHYDIKHEYAKNVRSCQYCDAPIFFAKTHNEKWLPVDGVSVDALDARQAKIRSLLVVDKHGSPHVEWITNPRGEVWIPHPDVCGAALDPPKSERLRERWQANKTKTEQKKSSARHDLQDIIDDIEGDLERET